MPGYIFLAPYRNLDPGPYIYDNWGNLVWSGAGYAGPRTAHTPRVCQYKGTDHLCYYTGEQHQGFARGHGVILDSSYRTVKTVEAVGAGASSDMHEFKLTPFTNGTTALMTVYQPRQYDLTTNARFNVLGGMGWVVESVFQEVDIETGSLIFEWRSLDHIDPGEAWTLPGTTDTSGDGLHEQSPWDYFHINSIDKNEQGDYLISARHVSAIYRISGKDGSIMWQMGGAGKPTFRHTNFEFSYQHHARWFFENTTHEVISFYDNASNGYDNSTGEFSHGWVVQIDKTAKTATVVAEWGAPELDGGLLSGSQGNMQLLPNGGCHIGWGEHAYFSEHTADGTATMYGKLADRASNVMIYRSNKYNWTAEPITKPALWTYSKLGADRMVLYVSWNGATEVDSWRFYTSNSPNGPWKFLGSEQKTGFETIHRARRYRRWAYAEALDVNGRVLKDSVIARTFIPSESLRAHCGEDFCDYPMGVAEEWRVPYEAHIFVDEKYLSPSRGFNTSHYYHGDDTADATYPQVGSPATWTGSSGSSQNYPVVSAIPLGTQMTTPASAEKESISGSYANSSIFILIVGIVIGVIANAIFMCLYNNGVLDSVCRKAFGFKTLGRYRRIRNSEEKDIDAPSSAASSSSRSDLPL